MNKKQMEEKIKQLEYELLAYRRPVGHSVINVRLEAKKEVFDDIETSDLFQEHISKTDWWNELKEEHLGEKHF